MREFKLFDVILRSKSIFFKSLSLDFESFRDVLEQQEVSLPSENLKPSVKNQEVNGSLETRPRRP